MDFTLSEEQRMLQDSLNKFVQSEYVYEHRRKLAATAEGFSREQWAKFAELGWLCLPFSEDDGGIGAGPVETMLLMDAFGRGLVLEPYFSSIVLCGGVLKRAANAVQRARWISGLIDGSVLLSLAYAEPGDRYNPAHVATTASANGAGYVLNGKKTFVLAGPSADAFIVVARTAGAPTDAKGISLFMVDKSSTGLALQAGRCLDGQRVAELTLANVQVGKEALLGTEGEALAVLTAIQTDAILALCAEAVGMMERLYKDTVEYTKARKQFGVPIAVFQALQHRMVEMFMAYEQCKSLLYKAVLSVQDNEPDTERTIAALKYFVGVNAQKVAHEAVQIHGGMGLTDEMSVGVYLKRINVINTLFGNAEHQLKRFLAMPA